MWFDDVMFLLKQPDKQTLERFLDEQKKLNFSYGFVGATRPEKTQPEKTFSPPGFTRDHNRILLGKGEAVFRNAVQAVQDWRAYALGWTKIHPMTQPKEGVTFCVEVNHFSFYSLSSLRIVYVVDEPKRFAFAIGTLPGHVEKGEERFMVEWLLDDTVWYDLLAFSRPQHSLVWLGYPAARALQKKFARDSKRAVQEAVGLEPKALHISVQ
jgi:uncharacterized protein (UPF0548 family)